jgi:hypothetical protein
MHVRVNRAPASPGPGMTSQYFMPV